MKQFTLFIAFLLISTSMMAQVGINNTAPNALLDISASDAANPTITDGILIPKIDMFPATDPGALQHSMMVYLTTTDGTDAPGFYYWYYDTVTPANSKWLPVGIIARINDLADGKSDIDGSNDGSSIFLGIDAGAADDQTNNHGIGIGYQALQNNINGNGNTAVGHSALQNATPATPALSTANRNTAIGQNALQSSVEGELNNAIGSNALLNNINGKSNTAVGASALENNINSNFNVALGTEALQNNESGNLNTALGYQAMQSAASASGIANVGVGAYALKNMDTGINNVGVGAYAADNITNGDYNIAIGYQALDRLTTGNDNIVIGHNAGANTTTDTSYENNIFIGFESGKEITSDNNVFIGYQSGTNDTGSGNRLFIENSNADENSALIYGEFDNDLLRVNGNFETEGLKVGDTNGALVKEILKATVAIDLPSIGADSQLSEFVTVTGAGGGSPNSTVHVSMSADLPDGVVIAWARVTGVDTVNIRFFNASTVASVDPASIDFYITVIEE